MALDLVCSSSLAPPAQAVPLADIFLTSFAHQPAAGIHQHTMPSTSQRHSFAVHPRDTTSLDHINFYTEPPQPARKRRRQHDLPVASHGHPSERCEDRPTEATEGSVDFTSSHEEPEDLGILLSSSASPNMRLASSDAAVDETLFASAERTMHALSNAPEVVHDLGPLLTTDFDNMPWDLECPQDTTETQNSEGISILAEDSFPDVELVSDQRCQNIAGGTQQQSAIASRAPSSDHLDKMKSQEEIGNLMDEPTPASHAMPPELTNHHLYASPPRLCAALNDSDSDSDSDSNSGNLPGCFLNSASPSSSSSATTPSLASSQSDLSTEQSKRTSKKRRASAAVYGSDHKNKRQNAKGLRSRRPPSQLSDKEACAATVTPCSVGGLTSPVQGELNVTVVGRALAITNVKLHASAIVSQCTVLTAVVRNAKNILEVSGSQAVHAFLMEMLGDAKEVKDVTYETLGEGMVLVTAIARRTSQYTQASASRISVTTEQGAHSTTEPDRQSAKCAQQPPKILEPFTNPSDGTSSSDSEIGAAFASVTAGRKRRCTMQGRSTVNPRRRRKAVCESSDTESCDSQRDQSVEQRIDVGRRRRRLSPRSQGRGSGEGRGGDATHSESDSLTDHGKHVGDVEANEAEVTVRRQSRRPWNASEEDFLKRHAGRKSWVEIGKELDRSPSGVSQHWRFMKQDLEADSHNGRPNAKRRRRNSPSR